AIRDVGRVLDVSYNKVDNIAKEIPFALGMTIDKALDTNPNLRKLYEEDGETKEIIDVSRKIEGMLRHASTHAAGVVISKKPIDEYVPLYKHQDAITTQFTMTTLEELGLLKMDFLGLRTLTVIRDALDLIEKNHNVKINFSTMEYDDPKVYELLASGNTLGVFQLESAGMRSFMKQLKPDNFEDIVAGISLYRPGPMDSIPNYINNKNNPEHVEYLHEKLKPIMEVTYGCLVYQEQVMQVVRDLGGYSYGRSDLVRRAMGKKKMDVMEKERQYFIHGKFDDNGELEIEGCVRNGVPEDIGNKIFDDMIDFAKYAFNKSHAAAYGVLAYETAYLKAHYPVEFMAALITSVMGNTDKVVEYIRECNNLKIDVLKPDINKSFTKFSVEHNSIRFGLAAVKNVGVNVLNNIIAEREAGGEFKDFNEFCKRLDSKDSNKRIIESLIKCGAFDEMGDNRASLLLGYEKLLESISMDRKKNLAGQVSLFDGFGMDESMSNDIQNMYTLPKVNELEEKERLYLEKEVLGMYVSGHPLSQYKEELKKNTTINNADLNDLKDDYVSYLNLNEKEVVMGGIIVNKTIRTTKRNDLMAIIELEDLYGVIEVIVFPQVLQKYNTIIQEDKIIYVEGRLSIKEDENAKLIAREIRDMSTESNQHKPNLYLKISSIEDKELVNDLISIVTKYPGDNDVYIYAENIKQMYKWNHIKVNINENLIDELKHILPKTSIKVKI
ncbi:MAG: DNA polymerase III subunit alpha, partial [Paeniclostridium sordellii]|nr:DNA polymerase III subunit alpha [Paeniclostridium sordellii]